VRTWLSPSAEDEALIDSATPPAQPPSDPVAPPTSNRRRKADPDREAWDRCADLWLTQGAAAMGLTRPRLRWGVGQGAKLLAQIRKFGASTVEDAFRELVEATKPDGVARYWRQNGGRSLKVVLRDTFLEQLAEEYDPDRGRRPQRREIRPIDENNGLTDEEIDRQLAEIERLIEAGVPA
jgi:hypothetical protein